MLFYHPKAADIRLQVENYFDQECDGCNIPISSQLGNDREHIIDIATTIKMNQLGIDTNPGSFVKAFLDNDLRGTVCKADRINKGALEFYIKMEYNLSIDLS